MNSVWKLATLLCCGIAVGLSGCSQQSSTPDQKPAAPDAQSLSVPASATDIQQETSYLDACFESIKREKQAVKVTVKKTSPLSLPPGPRVLRIDSRFERAGIKDFSATGTYRVKSISNDGVLIAYERGRNDGKVTAGDVTLKWKG
jgi:hypothetical protein